MRIAVLGLGEAGTIYAAGFAATGATVAAYDPADSPTPQGVTRAASVADAVRGAKLVLSLVTGAHAVSVAADAAPHLESDAFYADLNAASPQRKQEVGEALGDAAPRYADVAVIGSVPQFGPSTALIVSGPVADDVAELFRTLGGSVDAIGGQPGAASRRKILRTVFMKGLGAVITEAMDAGNAAGETDWVRAQISAALVDGESALDRLDRGTRKHALRRAHESEAAADLVASLGVAPVVTTAVANRHLALSRTTPSTLDSLLDGYAQVPTAAIGDSRDRLGVVHPRVRTMWPDAHLAGRALTVLCRPGDNKGIHRALASARPGDVLVVDGGGDASRALIGELIAHRAINRGVRGMIIDGAVRDVGALREAGFPVWAVGTSPAGPYKSGPYRLGTDVSVGGVVVHPGDLVVADADGVIVVPLAEAERTLARTRAVLDDEASRYRTILGERVAG
ncbi:NAD(P)-binding domain-containing protein [Prauserella cavernicola]|uniref:Putative 4-hydroxy-4-methyl-2-oxoglutarate aldolase n=1 Tax=Prauserella cavernicola TaxID=2800127 RepID=A0A934QN53_9PSEU|nr:NAD(P)-binding domain-containing protein [Prauserella cavernicola]MBK1783681.1 transferase [Prauserella cavernicola]